jgi:tetratricopeptide (TPR) repeat protein
VVPAAPVVEAPPAPEPAAPAPARAAPKEKADKPRGRARGALAAQGQGQGEDLPYDRLVAQADRLLENGANERALRLYERALTVRPDAPEALTGIGYVHLDRNRIGAAIEFFTKASAASPFAPALFGLGQAYRAAGDPGRARQTYQRYLALYPTGSDASAAERNLQALQPGNAAEAPGTILHEGGSGTPAADPAK